MAKNNDLAQQRAVISNEFFKFCSAHCCAAACKERLDYCPIADAVREKYGTIRGGIECQNMFIQKNGAY